MSELQSGRADGPPAAITPSYLDALRAAFDSAAPTAHSPLPKPEGGDLATHWSYVAWRLAHAMRTSPDAHADHAVLLRQLGRWKPGLRIGSVPESLAALAASRAGVDLTNGDVRAAPFAPDWLGEGAVEADAPPQVRRRDESFAAEGFLASVGARRWLSPAQKEAAWGLLTAPPGSTSLVALPTGAGKSLCFQLLARFSSGLTVVVVPTVALAIDQWESARRRLGHIPDLNPLYFASNDPGIDPADVVEKVKQRQCRLVFTSPEACVAGRLRSALEEAAKCGLLEHLVLDEAHLIETWGVYFRVDFQMLATLRRKWLAAGATFRTALLSATFTADSTRVLRGLYGEEGAGRWRQFVAQRLRPEMIYFAHRFRCRDRTLPQQVRERLEEDDRYVAVRDCTWHLPRPLIIYTTEVDAARALHERLRDEEGFRRTGLFTGDTRPSERRRLLADWRNERIDLMVGTSAFGLGVDKPDVRAVVHACLPENLHRYYQEVGRGGRDGASAVCLLLPTAGRDRSIAGTLGAKLLTEDNAQLRWRAMWDTAQRVTRPPDVAASGAAPAANAWRIRTNAVHMALVGARTGQQNVDWNRRMILQFLRAGLLELLDVAYEAVDDDAEPAEWLTVRPLIAPDAPDFAARAAKTRDAEIATAQRGLEEMLDYLSDKSCVNRLLQRVYSCDSYLCGGCRWCRAQGREPRRCPPLTSDAGNAAAGSARAATVIVWNCPDMRAVTPQSPLLGSLRRLVERRHRFVCSPAQHAALVRAFATALDENRMSQYRIDWYDGDAPDDERSPFLFAGTDRVVAFHPAGLDPALLRFRGGVEVVHLISGGRGGGGGGTGHAPLEREGAKYVLSLDAWLKSASGEN